MNNVYDLISQLDLDAFVDGQVSGERREAIATAVANNDATFRQLVNTARMNDDLVRLKSRLYKDPELAAALSKLLVRRAA